jgi:hypothetical protein
MKCTNFEAEILRKRALTEINKQINFEELDNDQKFRYLILASDTSICHIIGIYISKKLLIFVEHSIICICIILF